MSHTRSISAQIPSKLAEMLNKVAKKEERSKSYYIKKGLEELLAKRLEDLEDYAEAHQAYEDFLASGEKSVSLKEIKKRHAL